MLKKTCLLLLIGLSLLLIMLPACGGGDEEKTITPTATTTSTVTATATPTKATATPTPTTSEPVKIGVICAWSGPMAMSGQLADQTLSVVEQQVKDQGGILGGREVKIIRRDDRGVVAEAVGQARKLALEDKVDILCFGGESGASFNAVAQEAETLKIPYIAPATIFGEATMKYSISVMSTGVQIDRCANFPIEFVKPKTVAWLSFDDESARSFMSGVEGVVGCRDRWKAAGIDLVYEQYFPQDTMDFSAYLTAIKYKKPDLVMVSINNAGQAITINKQIMELGGWGDSKVYNVNSSSAGQKIVAMPAAVGNYTAVEWIPGSDDPGMKAFEDAFKKILGRSPTPDYSYYYNNFWIAIKAIEVAGTTDHDKVAQALRSGNFEWDSAWGHLRIGTDGLGIPTLSVTEVQEGGKLVKVWP